MRHPFLLGLLGLLGALALAGSTWALQSRYPYIVEATTRMLEVSAKVPKADPAELASAAKQACNALTQLLKDPVFRNELKTWSQNAAAMDRSKFKRDLDLFTTAFLAPEREILERAGYNSFAVGRILAAAATTQATIDTNVSDERVLRSIETLAKEMCTVSAKAETLAQRVDSDAVRRRWVLGVAGVALVVADVVVTGPAAVISGAVGALLLDRATPELAK